MRRSSVLLLASLGLGLSACGWQAREAPKPEPVAAAAPAAPGAAAAPVVLAANGQPVADPNQIVCKHDEVTGSRLSGSKVCHTRAEWVQLKIDGYDQMQMQRVGGLSPTQQVGGK